MLRFPNPGSTIKHIVKVYSAAFERLDGQVVDLDDIVDAVVSENLATSSGYMGKEAVERSTRSDRSRDPLHNQLKMYAELFRTLGWLHPTPESALNFTFTLLGKQIVAAGRDFWPLLDECVVGIVYPNPVLTIRGDFDLRPFATLLMVMDQCDGHLSRDEMILGPLSASTDRGTESLQRITERVRNVRTSKASMNSELKKLSNERGIQVNTLHNYTRWPIALLRDLGWAEKGRAKYNDGQTHNSFLLTDKGRALSERLAQSNDYRTDDIYALSQPDREALSVIAHFQMLDRAGFDIEPVADRLKAARSILEPYLAQHPIDIDSLILSPFQALKPEDASAYFTDGESASRTAPNRSKTSGTNEIVAGRDDRSHLFVPPTLIHVHEASGPDALRSELSELFEEHKDASAAVEAFVARHSRDTQMEFYPLVTSLFQILGFESDYSRAGVNYQRWDACVWADGYALPVEIKSPTEEIMLSTKAVRQAMENKVILMSRGGLETKMELTSLVVGNQLPNERGDMSNLIDDVFRAYRIRLGVIDLAALATLALRAINDEVTIDGQQLSELRGFLRV